jgi:hypothetical protein
MCQQGSTRLWIGDWMMQNQLMVGVMGGGMADNKNKRSISVSCG